MLQVSIVINHAKKILGSGPKTFEIGKKALQTFVSLDLSVQRLQHYYFKNSI
jgi:hypothetical protein